MDLEKTSRMPLQESHFLRSLSDTLRTRDTAHLEFVPGHQEWRFVIRRLILMAFFFVWPHSRK